ncbi:ATP-binding protein [Acuticoccus sp. I52.16.1]|uniref:ATP-binding protein n=1 Tax=Acuticoccus sp. I52.16.1 TaxID=2928472 RepID=UPI001FD1BB7F|nr:ATP-binding protein [Acuticoccus sp. I52.16.1]UOM35321.1 ATP-binding protein [Acuticoccus sp. I52.16.1]
MEGVSQVGRWLGRIFVPRTITAQFALLLVVALLVANVVALVVVGAERARVAREVRRGAQIERLAGIAAVMAEVPPHLRVGIAETTSSPFLRLHVDDAPDIPDTLENATARRVAARLSAEMGEAGFAPAVRVAAQDLPPRARLPRRDRSDGGAPRGRWHERRTEAGGEAAAPHGPVPWPGAERGRGGGRHGEGPGGWRFWPPEPVAVAIPFADGMWLNARLPVVDPGPPIGGRAVLMTLGFSLVCVLGVGISFTRRLTRPIRSLAAAAERAGEGDRSATAAVAGPAEVRRAAEAFNAMQRRIAQFDAERARTIAAVGHDLRTPITSLRIRAEMLEDEAREAMVRTLDEMRVMADGLLAYGRGEAHEEPRTLVDLAAMLQDQAGGGILYDGPPCLMIEGRPVALSRAFANLAENARRYGGGGRVRLIDRVAAIHVTVDDDGPGIPEDRLAEVLEPFVRLDASRSSETGGAGLGLSIARTVIRAHGGSLTLENRSEGGLRVTVTLPRDANARGGPEAVKADVARRTPAVRGKRSGGATARALLRRRERARDARQLAGRG